MKLILVVALIISIANLSYAEQEEIELTTYYPAPYGQYESLQVTDFKLNPIDTSPASKGAIYYDSDDDNIYYNTDGTNAGWQPIQGQSGVEVVDVGKVAAYNPNPHPVGPVVSKNLGSDFKLIIISGNLSNNLGGFIWKDGGSVKAIFHNLTIVVEGTLTGSFADTFIEAANTYPATRFLAAKVDANGNLWLEQGPASTVTYAVIK